MKTLDNEHLFIVIDTLFMYIYILIDLYSGIPL